MLSIICQIDCLIFITVYFFVNFYVSVVWIALSVVWSLSFIIQPLTRGTRRLCYLLTSLDTLGWFQPNLTQSILGWKVFKIDQKKVKLPSVEKNLPPKKHGFLVFNHLFFFLYYIYIPYLFLLPLTYRSGLELPPPLPKDRHRSGQLLVHIWHSHFQTYFTKFSSPLMIDNKGQQTNSCWNLRAAMWFCHFVSSFFLCCASLSKTSRVRGVQSSWTFLFYDWSTNWSINQNVYCH